MRARASRCNSETILASLILFTIGYIFLEKTVWLERAHIPNQYDETSAIEKSKRDFVARHRQTMVNSSSSTALNEQYQSSSGQRLFNSTSYPTNSVRSDSLGVFGGPNMLRPHGDDPGCFFLERLETRGLPVVHSVFADHVDHRVVVTGIRRRAHDYSWYTVQFLAEFYPKGFIPQNNISNVNRTGNDIRTNLSYPVVVNCDPIIPDVQTIGARPQGVVIITCNIPQFLDEVDMFKFNLRRADAPQLAYINITVCRSLVQSYERRFISMCTMLKDMDRYVAHWVQYHKQLGVEKVYIYDNARNSTLHNYHNVIPYLKSGLLTIIPWSHRYSEGKTYLETQIASENDCLWRHRHDATWVIKTDVDEFLQPMDENLPKWLPTYFNQSVFDNLAAMRLQNWFFCRYDKRLSRSKRKEAGGQGLTVFERNIYRAPIPTGVNKGRDKAIVRPDRVHYFKIHAIKWGGDVLTLDPYKEIRMVHYRGDNPRHPTFCPKQVYPDKSMLDLWNNLTTRES